MGIFNRAIFNNAIFNTDQANTIGGGGVADFRAYRKKLEAISRAADARLYKKVKKKLEKLPETRSVEVKKIVEQIQIKVDLGAVAEDESQVIVSQLNKLMLMLDKLIEKALIEERNEEELILLMVAV